MMRSGGRHTQQAVDILCNSSWYVLQTLVSVAGFRFAGLSRGQNGAFLGFAGLASGQNGSFLGFARAASGQNGAFWGFAGPASEEKGGFFAVAWCANLLRGSFLIVSRCANLLRGSFFILCTGCKLSARVLFHSLHGLQTPSEGPFLLFVKGIKGYN